MKAINLDLLLGSRFSSIKELTLTIKNLGAIKPHVFKSESELSKDGDFMLDGCVNKGSDNDEDYFTLFYIIDRAKNYYITETNYW